MVWRRLRSGGGGVCGGSGKNDLYAKAVSGIKCMREKSKSVFLVCSRAEIISSGMVL